MYEIIRASAERLSERGDWKRHVPWLLSSLGEALSIAHIFIYKNYPDRDDELTAVRLYRWFNPVHRAMEHLAEPRVSRYEGPYLGYLRAELSEHRSVLCTIRHPLPPIREYMSQNGIDRVAIVPIFAGDEWWGFLGVEDSFDVPRNAPQMTIGSINDILRTIATIIGESIRGASLDQALRWSEQLHRIQRDIAVATASSSSRQSALDELLRLICDLGDFDAGAIDTQPGGKVVRIASVGDPPVEGYDGWCHSCRPAQFREITADAAARPADAPVYGDATRLTFCERDCPLRQSGYHSYAVVPVVHDERTVAALLLFSSRRSTVPAAVRASVKAIVSEITMIIAMVGAEESGNPDH